MIEDIERVLLSEEQIHEIVSRLGRQISEDYKGKKLLMVSVLKGSVVFMADLMRAITIPLWRFRATAREPKAPAKSR